MTCNRYKGGFNPKSYKMVTRGSKIGHCNGYIIFGLSLMKSNQFIKPSYSMLRYSKYGPLKNWREQNGTATCSMMSI
jgi:hypothetical protein